MKYVDFKNFIYKTLIDNYDFKKTNKICTFENEDVIVLFEVVKSNYANDAYVRVGVTPKYILDKRNLEAPNRFEESHIYQAIGKNNIYELDHMDFKVIEKDIIEYFENTFPYMQKVNDIKKYYKKRKNELFDYMVKELGL